MPAMAAVTLLVAGCGTAVGDPRGAGAAAPGAASPTASRSGPPAPLPTSLAEARAAWKASAAATDYRLRVQRTCFCPAVSVTSTVTRGKVTASEVEATNGRAKQSAAGSEKDYPHTVEDLFALIERYDAERLSVTYSPQGVPLSVVADPNPGAIDDEFTYTVVFQATAGGTRVDDDRSWSKAQLPRGLSWPASASDGGPAGAQALVTRQGGAVRVYLGLWGSSSCPAAPVTLRPADVGEQPGAPARPGVRQRPAERVVTVAVDVDATVPADRMCTEDYGPTVYVATLPASLARAGTLPNLRLVASVATDAQDRPGVRAFVVPVARG
jgi:hypothetical protein